jgi:amidase
LPVDRLEFRTATALLAALERLEVSSCELLDHFLDRVTKHNECVNAVVTIDPAGARRAAEEADRARARGESLGPLHGLPMTVKDTFETAGLRTTAGVPSLCEHVPERDALAVARLRAAGAVLFGKTNTPTWAGDWQTDNPIFGLTCNPWDESRAAGGSSGGSAAALAAGLTPLEMGSDIGGSIRVPSHWCGVFGHKGSHGLVPQRGHLPGMPGDLVEADLNCVGPMARSVEDLELAFGVLAGPTPENARGWRLALPPPRRERFEDYRVAAWLDEPAARVESEMRGVLEAAVEQLARSVRVDAAARPDVCFRDAVDTYLELLIPLNCRTMSDAEFELARRAPAELDARASDVDRLALASLSVSYRNWHQACERRERMRARWADFFRGFDVLLCPVILSAAIPHDTDTPQLERTLTLDGVSRPYIEQIFWPGLITMALLPSTVIPVGRTAAGLPVGIQVVSGYLEDRTTLDFAGQLAEQLGTACFEPPPGF